MTFSYRIFIPGFFLVLNWSKFLYFAKLIIHDLTSRFPFENEGWNNITENDGSKTFFFRPHIYGPKSQNLLLILTNFYRIRGKLASNMHSAVGGLWSVVLLDPCSLYLCLPPTWLSVHQPLYTDWNILKGTLYNFL